MKSMKTLQRWLFLILLVSALPSYVNARFFLPAFYYPLSTFHYPLLRDSTGTLRDQIGKLADALNRRDLKVIRSQIGSSRIYVEMTDRPGAYLSNNQTLVVLESFIRSQTSISSVFDFVNDDGLTGSASGTLVAWKDGRSVSYKLNFGFTKSENAIWTSDHPYWLLTRISMK